MHLLHIFNKMYISTIECKETIGYSRHDLITQQKLAKFNVQKALSVSRYSKHNTISNQRTITCCNNHIAFMIKNESGIIFHKILTCFLFLWIPELIR